MMHIARFLMPLLLLLPGAGNAAEWSGHVSAEWRGFFHDPVAPPQHNDYLSIAFQPEFYHNWDNNRQSFTFVPFFRYSEHDTERTHADIRELTWVRAAEDWELKLGIRKVYWGVTEALHLVDIINQTDLVENIDGEDKLGQPMINLALVRDWGTVDLFMLPGFRERTFPSRQGRLRSIPYIDGDRSRYESSAEQAHVDWAVRWSHSFDDYDIGVSHFYGTSREPRYLPGLDGSGRPVLVPYYDIIHQTGLDLQATKGEWLWKLEVIRRSDQGDTFVALDAGFEYTFVGIFETSADLGVLMEYLYDDRGYKGPNPFQDDFFIGARLTFNDVQSTELLAGVIADRHSSARFFNLEASRRFGNNIKLTVEGRIFSNMAPSEALYNLRDDDYLQAELAYYF
jgi:hypothetical protein